jgi:hypothetical protein
MVNVISRKNIKISFVLVVVLYHIEPTSKQYSSTYYSLNGTYIKNFGIPDFTEDNIDFLINEPNQNIIETFLEDYYNVQLLMLPRKHHSQKISEHQMA